MLSSVSVELTSSQAPTYSFFSPLSEVRSYDAAKDLGSLTIELSFLDAGPKSVKGATWAGLVVAVT